MAFDIKPPNRQRRVVTEPVKAQPVKQVVVEPKPQPVRPKPVPPKPIKVAKVKPVKPQKIKKKKASKTGALISWIALFVVLGAVGYLVWQEESKKGELEKQNTKSGIIETFPGQNVKPEPNIPAPMPDEGNVATPYLDLEQEFDQNLQALSGDSLNPPEYDSTEWEKLNNFLDGF